MSPAQMPEHMVAPPDRYIKELSEGETAWTDFSNVSVDESGKTWLNNDGHIVYENFMAVKITRLPDNTFRLVIQRSRSFNPTWKKTELLLPEAYTPVSEISEEPGDYFDRKRKPTE